MGISLIPAAFLLRHAAQVKDAKSGVILGRQKLHMKPGALDRFVKLAQASGYDVAPDDLRQEDGFTERLLDAIGYPRLAALDFTDAEGAEHVHDLNLPLPDTLKERFDLVIDGGTTEHVFNIGQAIDNCYAMLKPGGLMLAYIACDGWFGHGFFQTGPDVPWRYWHHTRGCEMLEVSVVGRRTPRKIVSIPDPTGRRRGGEMFFEGPQMLLYAARKPLTAPPYAPPVQGHYVEVSHV